ncbi:MAG: ribonuclease P protein component 4 [Thermoplasmatota archaeon]
MRRDRAGEKALAIARIAKLEALAELAAKAGRLDRAARYGVLASNLATRYQTSLPSSFRRRLCKRCGAYLVPGRSARVRLRSGRAVITCAACGAAKRIAYGIPRSPPVPKTGPPRVPRRRGG